MKIPSDGTIPLVCDEISLGPPQPCTLNEISLGPPQPCTLKPRVFYGRVELEKVFPFYALGAAYSVGDCWQADVYVRGKRMAYLRPEKGGPRVLSALEADEGEG